ncbi:hypothetical protein J6590_023683 [Homalodisca vitripennis]|nr:hypothetical protein J6590_023683 [Homalodisca vitripennis]
METSRVGNPLALLDRPNQTASFDRQSSVNEQCRADEIHRRRRKTRGSRRKYLGNQIRKLVCLLLLLSDFRNKQKTEVSKRPQPITAEAKTRRFGGNTNPQFLSKGGNRIRSRRVLFHPALLSPPLGQLALDQSINQSADSSRLQTTRRPAGLPRSRPHGGCRTLLSRATGIIGLDYSSIMATSAPYCARIMASATGPRE